MTEPDTKELDALLGSLNTSAERFQTLWFSFLGLTLYLVIAAVATTHRNLLLREPQTLPILNVKVELLPFYVIAPLLYFVFHFYLLMMLLLLARTAAPFEQQLKATLAIDADRERYRAQVENALFLQLLVGMREERAGFNSLLLASIALITIVLAPLATLILMQMMFLPYHSFGITWWHRALVIADLGIVLIMWRRFFYDSGIENPLLFFRDRPRLRSGLAFAANIAAIYVVLWLSLGEGQWAGENQVLPVNFAATENGAVFGWVPDRLQLKNETIVGKKIFEETKEEIASRGGDFVPTRIFDGRDLQAAELSGVDLRGVSLNEAAMQGANLVAARLDGARVDSAQLQGASLDYAHLRGVELANARLQGARLVGARMEGANLDGAQLQGADLFSAKLQGANLWGSHLEGADLFFAQLQGADLKFARLQGANLKGAQLQGAFNLASAKLDDSEFDEPFVFRTHWTDVYLLTAVVQYPQADGVKLNDRGFIEPLMPADVDKWIAAATEFAGEREKAPIAERFARLTPTFQTSEQDAADHAKWDELAKQSLALDPTRAQHRRRLAAILGDLACEADGAPYVARALVVNPLSIARGFGPLTEVFGDRLDGVRQRLKSVRNSLETCPGVAGFTEDDWHRLDTIKPAQDRPSP